jgi:F-type H+-transporting ATPase subunit gamma
MSKRRDVEGHIDSLKEIHSIMESMKNLSMMEGQKLARYQNMQQQVLDAVAHALDDVRCHFAPEMPRVEAAPIYLLLGSERGFCGAYNEQLLEVLEQQPGHGDAPIIGVGSRLSSPLEKSYPRASCLPGAAVADEVDKVLASVINALNRRRKEHGELRLEVIYFTPGTHDARCRSALPSPGDQPGRGYAPLINLPSQQLLGELLEHYLFAVTHAWLFAAMSAENQRRMQHLDQAGHHIERQLEDLGKRRNALRQEEIIEEIEVILLTSELVSSPGMQAR